MNHIEQPTSLVKPPILPAKATWKTYSERRGSEIEQRLRLFEGFGEESENAKCEDNLEALRRRQPKAITPEQKRWTQIDTTEDTTIPSWMVAPTRGGCDKKDRLAPMPSPRTLSPSSPNRLLPTAFVAQTNSGVLNGKPIPKPRVRSVTPDFLLGKTPSERLKQVGSPSESLPVPYHKKVSDSVIYVPSQRMAYNRENPILQRRPRAQTQFDNVTNDSNDQSVLQRPRAGTNNKNEREKSEDRQSVMEIAKTFGDLKFKNQVDRQIARPKTLGYPIRNGYSDNLIKSNPDLLSDHSEPDESESPQPKMELGDLRQSLSKSLADITPIKMPETNPIVDENGTNKLKSPWKRSAALRRSPPLGPPPLAPTSTVVPQPSRPFSAMVPPSKPKRTYDHDVYAKNKLLQEKGPVTQTMSAAPHGIRRHVSPLILPPSINAKIRRVYDDVPIEEGGDGNQKEEEEEGYLLPSPQASPVAKNAPTVLPSLQNELDISAHNGRPVSTGDGMNSRRAKLQRSRRIERSQSTDELSRGDSFKIQGEYALPEVALASKRKKELFTRRKPEYCEPYLHRSSSEESVFQKTHDPVEDSEGYTVPGSHLWVKAPKEQEKHGIKLALPNISGEKLISSDDTMTNSVTPPLNKKFSSRRRKDNVYNPPEDDGCPPSPSFLTHKTFKTRLEPLKDSESSYRFRQRSKHVNMRQKIQSAFSSRQKAAKTEEDTYSITSEDSDADVNDTGPSSFALGDNAGSDESNDADDRDEEVLASQMDISDSEHEMSASAIRRGQRPRPAPQIKWTKVQRHTPTIHDFNVTTGLDPAVAQTLPADGRRPSDYVELYLTDNVLSKIVTETNRYATQLIAEKRQKGTLKENSRMKKWKPITIEELKMFLGVVLLTGLTKKQRYADYWSTDFLQCTPAFSAIMSRDRFLLIKQCLHFNNNLQPGYDPTAAVRDRLHKLRPFIDDLNERCLLVYNPAQALIIDESLILWRGRLLFRQSIRSKRARVGVKMYPICTYDGITLGIRISSAEDISFHYVAAGVVFSKTEQITLNLMSPYLDLGHHLYTDNFYTSPNLASYLLTRNTHLCGTVRPNRRGLPNMAAEDLQKGEMSHFVSEDDSMLAVKYREANDRAGGGPKIVHMLSTMHDTSTHDTGRRTRAGNLPIIKPKCVADYNKYMGGVDVTDQALGLASLCPMRKTLKWYQKVAVRLILQMILNAHKIYRKEEAVTTKHTMRWFVLETARDWIGQIQPRTAQPQNDHMFRLNRQMHIPRQRAKKKRAKCCVCLSRGHRRDVSILCKTCPSNPALCIVPCGGDGACRTTTEKSCFEVYHTMEDISKRP